MLAYHYNPDNCVFDFTVECQLDPLESERGAPVYLLPADCTFMKPPFKQGYVPVFKGSKWELVENHVGELYWLPSDPFDDPGHIMHDLGPLPEGAMSVPPEEPKEHFFERRMTELERVIQKSLDAFAATRGYDSINDAASYAQSSVEKYAAEGKFASSLRDAQYLAGYHLLNEMRKSKPSQIPTDDAFARKLPTYTAKWPVD